MVKAELSYNPYVQETNIRFNGQPPRINSHVEKYLDKKLQVWIKKVPRIFRDEMNGYGFDLEFSGTGLDYQELKEAFLTLGVSDEEVHLFHKNEMDERDKKLEMVEQLLKWLEENPNRRYDYERVKKENFDLFEGDYQYIILYGRITDMSLFDKLHISVENMTSIDEMKSTNLHNIPLLYVVNQESYENLGDDLHRLKARQDITPDQLFFRVSPDLNEEKVVREIIDFGIANPQVVKSADDQAVMHFFELYPYTDYIRDVIKLFKGDILLMKAALFEEARESESSNRELHGKIENLENDITSLKRALDKFMNPEKTDFSVGYMETKTELINNINAWRNRRTKITRADEAVLAAQEFEGTILNFYHQFLQNMWDALSESANNVRVILHCWYQTGLVDCEYIPEGIKTPNFEFNTVPGISNKLLELKEENYVVPRDDFLGRLFRQGAENNPEPVLEVTYYCQQWREFAVSVVKPYADSIIDGCIAEIDAYFYSLSAVYKGHLQELIAGKEAEKNLLSSQLSEDEKLLQDDSDWVGMFADKLKAIARD